MMSGNAESGSAEAVEGLRAIGREFHGKNWSLGTSSNYSVVASREPLELVITASGKDKSALGEDDFVRVDAGGSVIGPGRTGGSVDGRAAMPRPSCTACSPK